MNKIVIVGLTAYVMPGCAKSAYVVKGNDWNELIEWLPVAGFSWFVC